MPSRPIWKGFIQFSLVSIPVQAHTATAQGGGGRIALNQLHRGCNSRIRYRKTCPVHRDVPNALPRETREVLMLLSARCRW